MQEDPHIMNAYELKTKMDFDELSMMNPFSNPLDDFGSYPSDPYMYGSHTMPDMNQSISSIAEQTPPMAHIGQFTPHIPHNSSEKMPISVQLTSQTQQIGMGTNMGCPNSHFPNYISMSGVPMSHLGAPPNGSSMLPLQTGQLPGNGIPSMSHMLNIPTNNPALSHPSSTDQNTDLKPQISSTKQRDSIYNPGVSFYTTCILYFIFFRKLITKFRQLRSCAEPKV